MCRACRVERSPASCPTRKTKTKPTSQCSKSTTTARKDILNKPVYFIWQELTASSKPYLFDLMLSDRQVQCWGTTVAYLFSVLSCIQEPVHTLDHTLTAHIPRQRQHAPHIYTHTKVHTPHTQPLFLNAAQSPAVTRRRCRHARDATCHVEYDAEVPFLGGETTRAAQ
jgi:hypothetical protein